MEVTLIVANGPAQVRRIRLRSPETIVGRQKGCDLRIPSAEVSRRHCLLSFANGQLSVEDLDSSNGTYVNQVRIKGRTVVRAGDRLKIGPLTFTVDYPMAPRVGALPDAAASPTAPAQEAPTRPAKPIRKGDDRPIPLAGESGEPTDVIPLHQDSDAEDIPIEFDDATPLHLPEGQDFRDFLSRMDE
jgi:predicted component of type VI protein secretion system